MAENIAGLVDTLFFLFLSNSYKFTSEIIFGNNPQDRFGSETARACISGTKRF